MILRITGSVSRRATRVTPAGASEIQVRVQSCLYDFHTAHHYVLHQFRIFLRVWLLLKRPQTCCALSSLSFTMPLGVYAFLFALGYAYFNALLCLSQSVGDFIPAQVPLGIRSPYLNAWGNGNGPIRSWPGSYDLVSSPFYSLLTLIVHFRIGLWLDRICTN